MSRYIVSWIVFVSLNYCIQIPILVYGEVKNVIGKYPPPTPIANVREKKYNAGEKEKGGNVKEKR